MAAKIATFLPTLGKILGQLGGGSNGIEWQTLQKSLTQFGDLITRLVRESGRSRIVQQKALTALFEIRNSLQDVLDESASARYSRERCLEIFETLKNATEFERLDIGEFLSKEKLLSYGILFDAEGIAYAGELALITNEDLQGTFKPNMKPIPFSRLERTIMSTRKAQNYVEKEMEGELQKIQEMLEKADGVIRGKLSGFMNKLVPVMQELAEVIEDEELRMMLIVTSASLVVSLGALLLGGIGVGCAVFGLPALVAVLSGGTLTCAASGAATTAVSAGCLATSLGVVTIGGYTIYKAHQEMKREVQQLKNTHRMVSEWQESLRAQFLCWRELMNTFKQLFMELHRHRSARDMYRNSRGDIDRYFDRTKQLLEDSLVQSNRFEELIKELKNRKI